ncbi:hypothetical protein JOF40_002109 [Aeromicrobium fastidiosum]|nr:hypothetical protein [Aeromicrobium fastidiosum]
MASHGSPRPVDPIPRRRPVVLVAVLVGLVLAFTTLPALVAGALHGSRDVGSLTTALSDDLVTYIRAGRSSFGDDLGDLVGYWRAWHATKVVICALALLVLVALARDLWRQHERAAATTSLRWAATGVTILVPLAAVALAANIQSTAAPLGRPPAAAARPCRRGARHGARRAAPSGDGGSGYSRLVPAGAAPRARGADLPPRPVGSRGHHGHHVGVHGGDRVASKAGCPDVRPASDDARDRGRRRRDGCSTACTPDRRETVDPQPSHRVDPPPGPRPGQNRSAAFTTVS